MSTLSGIIQVTAVMITEGQLHDNYFPRDFCNYNYIKSV